MVDISKKQITRRTAKAHSIVIVDKTILTHFDNGEIQSSKGPVFQTAITAGIMAVKRTAELIPLCHPLSLDSCDIHIYLNTKKEIIVRCNVSTNARTGVEMEALTGASIAALTIYDMCKIFSNHIYIKQTKLIEKTGGKNDFIYGENF